MTSHVKGYPFEVGIPAGLDVVGVILADRVKSLDRRTRNARVVPLPAGIIDEVLQKVARSWQEAGSARGSFRGRASP